MSDLDDDAIIVNLEGEGDAAIKKVAEEPVIKKVAADDPISDLKGQFETLKGTVGNLQQTNQQLSQRLTERDQELAETKKDLVQTELDTVAAGIQAAEAEAAAAERDYIAAAEAGDFAAQARAQRKMAAAEGRKLRLEEAKGDLQENAKRSPTQKTEARPEPRQAQQDPVEAVASTMAPRAAAWIRSHPDCITDRAKNAKMMATHYEALAEGLVEGSDAYFAKLDAWVSGAGTKPTPADPEVKADATSQRRPSSAAAPAAGASGGMNGGGHEVRLTRREAEAAVDGTHTWNYDDPSPQKRFKKGDAIGVQEFARRKAQMMKEGHYDRNFTDN